jgi:hypothetical protein
MEVASSYPLRTFGMGFGCRRCFEMLAAPEQLRNTDSIPKDLLPEYQKLSRNPALPECDQGARAGVNFGIEHTGITLTQQGCFQHRNGAHSRYPSVFI